MTDIDRDRLRRILANRDPYERMETDTAYLVAAVPALLDALAAAEERVQQLKTALRHFVPVLDDQPKAGWVTPEVRP